VATVAHAHRCLGLHVHAFQGTSDDFVIRILRLSNRDRSFVNIDKKSMFVSQRERTEVAHPSLSEVRLGYKLAI